MATYWASGGAVYQVELCRSCRGAGTGCADCRGMGFTGGSDVGCGAWRCHIGRRGSSGPDPNCELCHGSGVQGERGDWRSLTWYGTPPSWIGDPDWPCFGPRSLDAQEVRAATAIRILDQWNPVEVLSKATLVRIVSDPLDPDYHRARMVRVPTSDEWLIRKEDVVIARDDGGVRRRAEPVRVISWPIAP